MIPAALLTCALMAQQLSVLPFPGTVGEAVTIRASGSSGALVNLAIQVEPVAGATRFIGSTDAAGALVYVPAEPGYHVFVATIDGVRNVAPLAVVPARRRVWWAVATAPLGLLLLWSAWPRRRLARAT